MMISEKLPSQIEIIPAFILKVKEELKSLSVQREDVHDIALCLHEALVNAIKHGNRFSPDLEVEVRLEADADRLTVTVKDQGQGFDYTRVPDPTKPDNLEKTSGRGVFLVKRLMDRVDFSDEGRGITMTKFFKKRR
ncbi:MAG: ATP-binding protein [Candidatus Omnitrophota bacterium]